MTREQTPAEKAQLAVLGAALVDALDELDRVQAEAAQVRDTWKDRIATAREVVTSLRVEIDSVRSGQGALFPRVAEVKS